jgi:hypothetical protein
MGGFSRKGLLFLKKKKQRDFYPFARGEAVTLRTNGEVGKVFWFFFSKKNMLT